MASLVIRSGTLHSSGTLFCHLSFNWHLDTTSTFYSTCFVSAIASARAANCCHASAWVWASWTTVTKQ